MISLCEKFGCLPSALMAEDAGLLRLLAIQGLGNPEPPGPDWGDQSWQ